MITLTDFKSMPYEKQCEVVTFSACFLSQRRVTDFNVFLYHVDNFFIEIFYSSRHAKVIMLNSFEKNECLDPYLEKISLAEINF